MVGEAQRGGVMYADWGPDGEGDQADVSTQFQQVYKGILNEQHPEAATTTEQLAYQLNIGRERPPDFPEQTRR